MTNSTLALHVAVAQAIIPSEPGLDLAGFVGRDNPSSGKRDEIYARVLALRTDKWLILFLAVDVLGFEGAFIGEVRSAIADQLKSELGEELAISVTVSATHTHSAPVAMRLRNCGDVNEVWLRQAVATMIEVALQAVRQLQPARLGVGIGPVSGIAGNRRTTAWVQGDVTTRTSMRLSSEPLDTALSLLRIEAIDGTPMACMVNYTCHPVILGAENHDISADYPGLVTSQLLQRLGAVTLFTNGAAADVNPGRRGSWADVEHLADALVIGAERVWHSTQTAEINSVGMAKQVLKLPLLPLPSAEELKTATAQFRRECEAAQHAGRGAQMRVADAYEQWAEEALKIGQDKLYCEVEIQVVRLGDTAFVAVPGELFVELGLAIKRHLAERAIHPVFILGYTNGNIGYIPTRTAYPQGGYEVETAHRFYGRPACVAPEAGEMIVNCSVALAAKLWHSASI